MDLLLGGWAAQHLPTLPADQLAVYDGILQLETVTLYNVLTHRSPIPPAADSPLLRAIVEYTKGSPLGHASPEVRHGPLWGWGLGAWTGVPATTTFSPAPRSCAGLPGHQEANEQLTGHPARTRSCGQAAMR